ncbi:MFS general substrate transporter [Punctularia strigosozonata HHB-11173 SS5]|uniref:MFS general substrate transporter n=1 Tax=Punctularia strigosozonata (strain HHB-11173) TaxID=741275 RepID=UPI0004417FD2|nr:MFS general substrate transporter [Punctularia strigosozonata HHB-11173 SS5]EIN09537.1 MFS general substrate transporter [Punctularia strigosozonata HHB-11173 SS5]
MSDSQSTRETSAASPSKLESAPSEKPPQSPEAKEAQETHSADDYPDGGLRAWVTIAGSACVMFCTFGMTQAFGPYQDYYTRFLLKNHTPSEIAWIGSVQIFLLYFMGLFTGGWFDAGYFRRMLIPGAILYVFSFFMLSLCKPGQYYQFLLSQGFGMGLGMGLMCVPSISIIAHYFRKRRALASGLVFSGTSLGGVIWPIMTNRLLLGSTGFAWGVRASAFLCLGVLSFAVLMMRPRFTKQEHRARQPSGNLRRILTDVTWGVCLLGTFVVLLGLSFPFVYLQLFAALHGVPAHVTDYTLAILFASGTLFGRMLPGILADKFGVLNVMLPYTIVGGGLIFAMFGATNTAGLVVFAVLYGPCGGAFNSLFAASIGSYMYDISEFGLRLGLCGGIFGIGYLIGSPITGALLQPPKYTWKPAIIFSGVTVLAGCAIILVSRQMLVRRKGSQKV